MTLRSRQRGQSVVEFGIIAILFTLLMFAVVDFGLLLNTWLSVSTGARQLARDAAVGAFQTDLVNEAKVLKITGVTGDPHFGGVYCCATGNALVLNVTYYDQCTPGVGACLPVSTLTLDSRYAQNGTPGGCNTWQAPPVGSLTACPHPSPPKAGACGSNPTCPGDSIVLTLTAAGAQVVTPLVRPFFASPGICPDSSSPSRCYVSNIGTSVTMRFEGDTL